MKIEDQVVSLELAREMKRLGAKQDSLWWWNYYIGSKPYLSDNKRFEEKLALDGSYIRYSVSAYTVAELGEMLPEEYRSGRRGEYYICEDVYGTNGVMMAKEADARAKMWIYLKEEGLI